MSVVVFTLFFCSVPFVAGSPHLYNPYYNIFNLPHYNGYSNYADQIPHFSPNTPSYPDLDQDPYSIPDVLPTLNVLAESPYAIDNKFTVVPMVVVSKENMRTVSNAEIMSVSKKRPLMTVRNSENVLLQCTPAVRIVLDKPIIVYSLRTHIVFPSEIDIVLQNLRIPIEVGAIIAPVRQDTYISLETPVAVRIVYAVPTRPVAINYITGNDAVVITDSEAVVVDSQPILPPKNVTILDFPDKEAEPVLQVDEADEELVNRNPPTLLAPAGIVQSTQPISHVEPFTNPKESPFLTTLRQEAQKRV